MKRVFIILLAALLLFCGAGGAAVSSFYVDVFDAGNGNAPIQGASVTLADKSSATLYTASAGTAVFKDVEYPKTYTVTVSKTGYIPQTKTVSIKDANQREPVYLSLETPVLITVTGNDGKPVSNADVAINKKSAGKTDANGRLHASMIRGSYNTVEISAPAYLSYSKELFLEKDASALSIELSLSRVNPLILVYSEGKEPVSGASVFINGNLAAYTDSYGRAQLATYTAGTYDLKVEADDFAVYTGKAEFTENNKAVTVELSYATAVITVKALANDKPVAETVIYFDGDIRGITDANGVYTTTSAPGAKIHISASHDGYSANGVTYTVEAGDDNLVIISMEQNVPVVLIGIGIFAVLIILAILVLVISGRRRKPVQSPPRSYPPTNKRDSL
ncbi:MAG: hypothetical protein E7Z72_05285 [Methanocorpusculum parvum]|nr:hypothetical protein [Methanocorpusculum parvum]